MASVELGKGNRATREITSKQERLEKICEQLSLTITRMEDVFSPILKNVPTCENAKDLKGCAGDCEFETMVYKVENRVSEAIARLESMISRSAV